MPNISLESKVAIGFIKPYRKFLDKRANYLSPEAMSNLEKSLDSFADILISQKLFGEFDREKIKEKLLCSYKSFAKEMVKRYEECCPLILDQLIVDIENVVKENFSESEKEELLSMFNNDLTKRLLLETKFFDVIDKAESSFFNQIGASLSSEKMQEIFGQMSVDFNVNEDKGFF